MLATLFAEVRDRGDTNIDVDAGGLFVGFLILILCIAIGVVAAQRLGEPLLKWAGVLVGVVIFFFLGFDVT